MLATIRSRVGLDFPISPKKISSAFQMNLLIFGRCFVIGSLTTLWLVASPSPIKSTTLPALSQTDNPSTISVIYFKSTNGKAEYELRVIKDQDNHKYFMPLVLHGNVKELKILWAQWAYSDYLQEIGNLYEQETGIKVIVTQEPWGTFEDRFFTEMDAGGDSWDMVLGDSQWLGEGATQGHYLEITSFLVASGISSTVTEATLTYYGEYPSGSGHYYAFPAFGDGVGWAYRKDLLENPSEMAAFKTDYGYTLSAPDNFDQLTDIAKFFTRPNVDLYGVAIYTQMEYDVITMGVENSMFSWGGEWKDESMNVMGVVNSKKNIEALKAYKKLYDCCQVPGLSNAFFVETTDAFINGRAVIAMNYFPWLQVLANPQINPYANKTGFFVNPAGPSGARYAALGGQGISITSYISPVHQKAAKDFIQWFAQDEIQYKWSELGGNTCNANVLQMDAFLNAEPFNPAYAQTMMVVKDFWNIPEYNQLLDVTQREFHNYIVKGIGSADVTMDLIAEEHDAILRAVGYIE